MLGGEFLILHSEEGPEEAGLELVIFSEHLKIPHNHELSLNFLEI